MMTERTLKNKVRPETKIKFYKITAVSDLRKADVTENHRGGRCSRLIVHMLPNEDIPVSYTHLDVYKRQPQ